jgi:hypothetical protein
MSTIAARPTTVCYWSAQQPAMRHPAKSVCTLCAGVLTMLLSCGALLLLRCCLCLQQFMHPAQSELCCIDSARMLYLPCCRPALLPVPAGVRPSAPPLTLARHAVQALRAPPASAQTHHVGLPAQCIMSTCLVPNPKEHMSAHHDTVEQYS